MAIGAAALVRSFYFLVRSRAFADRFGVVVLLPASWLGAARRSLAEPDLGMAVMAAEARLGRRAPVRIAFGARCPGLRCPAC